LTALADEAATVGLYGRRTKRALTSYIISNLLSLKLGYDPGTEGAHSAVRAYLQAKLDAANDPGWSRVSQWLREAVLLDLVDKKLSTKYWTWFDATTLGPERSVRRMWMRRAATSASSSRIK
jgi:hypothetical protein